MKNKLEKFYEIDTEKMLAIALVVFVSAATFFIIAAAIALFLAVLVGCNSQPPNHQPPQTLPELCLEFTPRHGLGWLDFAPKNKWIVVAHHQDIDPGHQGIQKAIELWAYTEPGQPAELIDIYKWTGPLEYLSYPGFDEQGPVVCGNFIGGDSGAEELAFIDYQGGSYRLNIARVVGGKIKIIKSRAVPTFPGREIICMDLIAGNMSVPRGNRYSDLIVGYRHWGKTIRIIKCYRTSDLSLKWEYTIEAEGMYSERWACHRFKIIHYPNGRDALWYGLGILDWNGQGIFDFHGVEAYPAELHDLNDGDFEDLSRHWDSFCHWSGPGGISFMATEDGPRIWRFPALEKKCYDTGRCYVEANANGGQGDFHHTHRLFPIDERLLAGTDIWHDLSKPYKVFVMDNRTMQVKWQKAITLQEARDIEWDGNHNRAEILTDGPKGGVYDYTGQKLYARNDNSPMETNHVCDLFGYGHEQFAVAKKKAGKWRVYFYANDQAEKGQAIPARTNDSFY